MDVRVLGDRQVNHGLSRFGSLSLLLCLTLGCLALQPVLLTGMSTLEQMFTGNTYPDNLHKFLSVAAPAVSISAMASPLLACWKALQFGSANHGLQWHLFVAFAIASCLGTVYGIRADYYAIVSSNLCGLAIQLISLAAVYALSDSSRRFSKYAFDKLMAWMPSGWKESRQLHHIFHWAVYVVSAAVLIGALMTAAWLMPLRKVLGPLFTVICVLPYVATFSTFPKDIRGYRRWERLPYNSAEKAEGPKGVDITTLVVMQVNNVLWNWYGMLIRDQAVLISSLFSIVAATVQLVVYMFPVVDLPRGNQIIRLDAAYPFLGSSAFLTKGGIIDNFEASEKLRTVELMPTTSSEAVVLVSEPPFDETLQVMETPVKFARSEGLGNHYVPESTSPLDDRPWSLYHTGRSVVPRNPDI